MMAVNTPPPLQERQPRWRRAGLLVLSTIFGLLCTVTSAVAAPTTPPAQPECGITDLSACVNEGFSSFIDLLVGESLNWLLQMLGSTLLSTPTLDQLPRIGEIWEQSRLFVVATYSLLVLLAGILVMGHQGVQTRYSIREIAPRVVAGFVAANLSLLVADQAIRFANAASMAMLGDGLDPQSAGKAATELFVALVKRSLLDGGLFAGLLSLALTILLVGLLVGYVIRVGLTALLVAGAPLALMCHGLPQLEGVARWFWRSGAGVLGIQVGQSLALVVSLRVFLEPGGFTFFGAPTADGIINLIVLVALVWILVKIPTWVMNQVRISGGGRSFLGGLAYALTFGKAMALVSSGRLSGAVAGAAHRSSPGGLGRRSPSSNDPPWPPQPRFPLTPEMVSKRLKAAYDAERLRAARRPRVPSQSPRFLQPQPQQTVHDPAVTPAALGPTVPEFSSAAAVDAPTARPGRGPRPGSSPQFQVAGGPRRRSVAPKPVQAVRVASVPPQLQFRPATPPPAAPPTSKPTSAPPPPVFQQAQPEPRIGDAHRRTHSVPPPVFRAPKATGGEQK
ncbi:hypothetical protein [Lentzea cavernae]|uniref:TrbL/VirB6 plasmid conjugal transfer protein n=1 Tax=Lentzea cavernae TaxID=2020703 RepID=A0ABQ3MW83_9PSEU|nr:hypothetical protein [Lentzea cavernae]GHH62399.1 hypothetical protein GCM10017774_90070 [Lentzea cavernae]